MRAKFKGFARARIVIEAGAHSPWVKRVLEELAHEVIVANPRRLRMIYESDRKNDRVDARMLARVGRLDVNLLAPVWHRSAEVQADLAVVRSRNALVAARTQLINAVRGMVKCTGSRLPKCTTAVFAKRVGSLIPAELRAALAPLVESIHALSEQIRGCDQQVESLADRKYPETKLLRQVKGVGPLISLTYVLTVEDPNRFRRSRQTWVIGRPPAQTPGFLFYVMVDSVETTLAAVVANGGRIIQPIGVDAPEITARFVDPAGNVIGLYQQSESK